ncbi:MAG: TIGR01212 family radical SAM protein [Clostridia bacterium]|nr:TIGR01212 family radical SAM protein [Clostridia bacterium]
MRINNANSYFKQVFGTKIYKVGISLNVTCPNRGGTVGSSGCSFCSAGGSGEFSEDKSLSITEQLENGIAGLKRKCGEEVRYIAYFQSFTNTYCAPEYLRKVLEEAMTHTKVVGVSIATRPDCLPDSILNVLQEFVEKYGDDKPRLFVELGLQTSDDKTAEHFNRGYATCVYDEAVIKLHKIGANVITHVIFGLPDETQEIMMRTVRHVCEVGTDGVKFTCLYVLKDTEYGKLWEQGKISVLDMEEYFNLIAEALKILDDNVVVHRLTGDGPKKLLLAPEWTKNKRNVVNYINKRFYL